MVESLEASGDLCYDVVVCEVRFFDFFIVSYTRELNDPDDRWILTKAL